LIDDKEFGLLSIAIEEKMKRLWNSPSYITPSSPELLFGNINWIMNNADLSSYIIVILQLTAITLYHHVIQINVCSQLVSYIVFSTEKRST